MALLSHDQNPGTLQLQSILQIPYPPISPYLCPFSHPALHCCCLLLTITVFTSHCWQGMPGWDSCWPSWVFGNASWRLHAVLACFTKRQQMTQLGVPHQQWKEDQLWGGGGSGVRVAKRDDMGMETVRGSWSGGKHSKAEAWGPCLMTTTRTTRTAVAKQCSRVMFCLMTVLLNDGNSSPNWYH